MNGRKSSVWRARLRLAAVVGLLAFAFAQSAVRPGSPEWYPTTEEPPGANYFYIAGRGRGTTETEAVENAEKDAVKNSQRPLGVLIFEGEGSPTVKLHSQMAKRICTPRMRHARGKHEAYVLLRVQKNVNGAEDFDDPYGDICNQKYENKVKQYNNDVRNEESERERREAAEPSRREAAGRARWLSAGAGMGLVPDKTAEWYSSAVPGLAGAYVSGRYGDTWGVTTHTWGIGMTGGIGSGSRGGMHVGGGVNIYPFNDFFVQLSYGTALYSHVIPSRYENGMYIGAKTILENGYSVMAGYDFHVDQFEIGRGHIMFSLAGGVTQTESSNGWLLAYSAAVGYVINY